jgi:multisubunit Na+/H+ antiporter MnhG subunit
VSMREWIAAALAGAGVGLVVLCALGVLLMRDALARLHYASAAWVAAIPVAAGLVVTEGLGQLTGRALLLAALLAVGSPVQAHVTARAIHLRRDARQPRGRETA